MPFKNIETVYNRLKEIYAALDQNHYITHSFDDITQEYNSRFKTDITLFRDNQIALMYSKNMRVFFLETTYSNQIIDFEYMNKINYFYELTREANMNIKNVPYS